MLTGLITISFMKKSGVTLLGDATFPFVDAAAGGNRKDSTVRR